VTWDKAHDNEHGEEGADGKGEAKERTENQIEKKDVNSILKLVQKADERSTTELTRSLINITAFFKELFKAYPEAASVNLPPLPLSRKGMSLFAQIGNLPRSRIVSVCALLASGSKGDKQLANTCPCIRRRHCEIHKSGHKRKKHFEWNGNINRQRRVH
jgi:hypothetical protein